MVRTLAIDWFAAVSFVLVLDPVACATIHRMDATATRIPTSDNTRRPRHSVVPTAIAMAKKKTKKMHLVAVAAAAAILVVAVTRAIARRALAETLAGT